jgi:UDP:flavonoid glycosyltransferase YjiC (YdhE family)
VNDKTIKSRKLKEKIQALTNQMGNPHILVLPYPVQGHVLPLMEFGQTLAKHNLKVTFINSEAIQTRIGDGEFGDNFSIITIEDGLEPGADRDAPGVLYQSINRFMPQKLEELIRDINSGGDDNVTCLVADITIPWAQEVAAKLGIRRVGFNPASAAFAALIFSIPKLIQDGIVDEDGTPLKHEELEVSSNMPIMNTKDFVWLRMGRVVSPKLIFHDMKNSKHSKHAERIICNSMYDLEPGAFNSYPELVPVGPLLARNRQGNSSGSFWKEDLSSLAWLDQQPDRSVIYAAFGSIADFSKSQFEELALGLELTNRPFLWVVRPKSDNSDLENDRFPEGFLDRVSGRGKLVSWTAQQKVLSHRSIACFMSHCGWNSTVECVSNGVPFICWPYFSDQFSNETYICDIWKVGLRIKKDGESEESLIRRLEIKDRIERLFGDHELAERALDLKGKFMKSVGEDGSSRKNLMNFVEWIKQGN